MVCYVSRDDVPSAAVGGGSMDINEALQEVLKTSLIHGGVVHGLHEAAKSLDKWVCLQNSHIMILILFGYDLLANANKFMFTYCFYIA